MCASPLALPRSKQLSCRFVPVSPPVPPVICISAASARRCSIGSSPGSMAGSSCCGSTIPTRAEMSPKPAADSAMASAGWASIGTKGRKSAARMRPYFQSQRGDALSGSGRKTARKRAGLSRLRHDRGTEGRARAGQTREAGLPLQPPLDGRDRRRCRAALRPRDARRWCG